MEFEVINEKNKVVMHCNHFSCLPTVEEMQIMSKAGYKFKVDGKNTSITKLKEMVG